MKILIVIFFIIFFYTSNCLAQVEIKNFKIQYDTCRVNFNNGKYEASAKWLESNMPTAKFQQKEITYWDMNNLLAKCYVKLGKIKKAELQFKETIRFYEQNPTQKYNQNNYSAIINLAYLYFAIKSYEDAEKMYFIAMQYKKEQFTEKHPEYISLLNNVAVLYNIEGKNAKAEKYYTELQRLRKEIYTENSPEYINTLYNKANLFKTIGRYLDAEQLYMRVVEYRRTSLGEKHIDFLNAYKHLGELYMLQRRYNETELIFSRLVVINKEINGSKHKEYTEAFNNLGALYIAMERYEEAEKIFVEVSENRKNSLGKTHLEYGNSLSNLGLLYRKMGKYLLAEKFYKKTLEIYEINVGKKHTSYVATLVNMAGMYREMGRFLDAETRYRRAKEIFTESVGQNNIEYAGLLNNMALFYTEIGKYDLAESDYKESLSISESLVGPEHPEYATSLNNLASLYKTMGRYEEAENIYLKSTEIRKLTIGENNFDYASSLNNLGALYEIMGRFADADNYYNQALVLIRNIFGNKHPTYANQLNNLAGLYTETKEYSQAASYYQEALDIQAEVLGEKHPDYITTLNNLALLQQKTGNYEKAEELYKKNISKIKSTLGTTHPNYATALSNLAGLYEAIVRYKDAEALYNQALNIRKSALGEKHPAYGLTLTSLARLYSATGNHVKADSMWAKAINLDLYEIKKYFPSMSEKEKGEFYATIKAYFEQFNSYALLRYKKSPSILSKMYNNHLATKALLLNASNKLRQTILESGDTLLIDNYKNWLNQKEFLSKVYAMSNEDRLLQHINVDSLEQLSNSAEKNLSKSSELFKNANEQNFYTWQDVKKELKSDEAAMEIIRINKFNFDSAGIYSDSVYYAALIIKATTTNQPELVLMREGAAMETKLIKYYRNSIKNQTDNEYSYKYFWREIADNLKGIKKVYVSLDGAYNQVNLNTLLNVQTKKYVFDEIDIQIVSNTKDLIAIKKSSNSTKNIALFGNPDFLYQQKENKKEGSFQSDEINYVHTLAVLPGTEAEVKKIEQLSAQNMWQSKLYLGNQATEKTIKKLTSPKVLHIATHGFFDNDASLKNKNKTAGNDNPLMKSGLMLAGSDITLQNKKSGHISSDVSKEDGILTAYEAMNLNLDHTDLVILSACETGLGEVKNGEGVYGLQRAFQVAGSKSIVNSLWTVNDQTTMLLMTNFYEVWMKTGDKKNAFRNAMTVVRKQYPHPYYWGAFVMIGD